MMARLLAGLGFCAGLLTIAAPLRAADCGCDHTIALSEGNVKGTDLGVKPGDVVCVEAGERPFLILEDFVGTASAPIVIKNCGGQVKIANSDKGYGLAINGSSFFHVTGTGDSAVKYGFDVSASRTAPDYSGSGVPVGSLSTDYELDHIEVHHTGFAGFILKTESRCDGSANLGSFVQKNTHVHDTYTHDTGGEGFYVGSTGYGGRDFTCNDQTVKLYPKHLSKVLVSLNDFVPRGVPIGLSGSTGYSTGPHAHVMREENCGVANCQSIPLAFADVPGNGVPTTGQTVTSGNCP